MPNQFLSDEFGDIEDYFVTDYWLIDNFVGDSLWTWGRNDGILLGINDGSTIRSTPVTTFAGGTNWKQVSCGKYHTLAIKTDGSLWGWGRNENGDLGDFAVTNRSTPVTTFAGGNNWKSVSGGQEHTVAIKTDGSLWTWGRNSYGALGTNSSGFSDRRSTPVTTFAGGNNWKSIAIGIANHTAAIKTDGSLWVWGRNTSGELGINNTTNKNIPVTTFAGGNDWKSVSIGDVHTIAIKTDGSLWIWGGNNQGQLGTNDTTNRNTPVTTFAGGNNWKQVSGGLINTAAIKTDGSLWGWGNGDSGLLGNNSGGARLTPVTTFAGGNNWKSVAFDEFFAAAIKTDGSLWLWGQNVQGQLGINNTFTPMPTPVTTFAGGNNWKSVAVGGNFTAAIKSGLNVDLS